MNETAVVLFALVYLFVIVPLSAVLVYLIAVASIASTVIGAVEEVDEQ